MRADWCRAPKGAVGDCADETALNEIVGPNYVSGQRARVAAQTRDLFFKQPREVVHRETPSLFRTPPGRARRHGHKCGEPM